MGSYFSRKSQSKVGSFTSVGVLFSVYFTKVGDLILGGVFYTWMLTVVICTLVMLKVHYACCRLRVMRWSDRKIQTVVEIVRNPKSVDEFPGFYVWMASRKLWAAGNVFTYSKNPKINQLLV